MTDGDTYVHPVRVEHHREAFGIGEGHPRLSWTVSTQTDGWRQSAYELHVLDETDGSVHSSGRRESEESVLVAWPGPGLRSRDRRRVAVRVWGRDGEGPSAWSEPTSVEAGLLERSDWTASLVTPDWDAEAAADRPGPLLRHEFTLRTTVSSARLYVTAHGVYELELNGARVGDDVLAPGWQSYCHRLRYRTFDVTSLLQDGENAIGAALGDGWFRGPLGFGRSSRRDVYGDRLALLAQLEVRYADGTSETVGTDAAWRAARGPILESTLYGGELHDARLERPGWSATGFDDADWVGVRVLEHDRSRLVAPTGPPVRRTQLVEPAAVTTSPSGRTIVDFGQNVVGRLRIRVCGSAGQTVRLRHAEVLEGGELAIRPLRAARATDEYTLRGGAMEEWEPRFTFHGFRYAEITGWPGTFDPADVRAVVCHTDMQRTGWFSCSDPLLERLHDNVVWSMRGNFLDIPTDCPQRDERLGWTGDIQVFAATASFLYDCSGMLVSWLADLAVEQLDDGLAPVYVPFVDLGRVRPEPAAAWGDAAVIVPWVLYAHFGDLGLLQAQYPSMRRWVDQVAELTGDRHLWDRGFQFGDWLDPAAPPDQPGRARTDPYLVATAYFARSADLLARTAALLGQTVDHERYESLAGRVRSAFQDEYVTRSGRLVSDSQTAYALALQFGLLPDEGQRRRAGSRLADLVRDEGYRIGTGFVGTPLVCDALCEAGEVDAAYRLLLQRDCPSWLYPVTMGASTVWERWDSMLPDGRVNPGEMTSFNHYALGAVADWLHRTVAGLAPAAPGYRRLLVRPRPGGGLKYAGAVHETPYGRAEVAWNIDGEVLTVDVVVPPGTSATVVLPFAGDDHVQVESGRHRFRVPFPATRKDAT